MKTTLLNFGLILLSQFAFSQNSTDSTFKPDSIFLAQDSILNSFKGVFNEVYPKIKEKDKRNISVITELIRLTANKTEAQKLSKKIYELTKKDTSDWDIGKLILNQEFGDYLYYNDLIFYRMLDWKDEATEMARFLEKAAKRNFNTSIRFSIKDTSSDYEYWIHNVYKSYGQELENKGLKLFNMDINCDCYLIFLVKKENAIKIKKLIPQLGFKYEDWSEQW